MIYDNNIDSFFEGRKIAKSKKNKRLNSLSMEDDADLSAMASYIYPKTYVRLTALDPINIVLARTYLTAHGKSNRQYITWTWAKYSHWQKSAAGFPWPFDTTWFREYGARSWPSPSTWTTGGYETSTQARYANWDWGFDDRKTSVYHTIWFRVLPSGSTSYNYRHTDWGEDSLAIRGIVGAATYY